MQSAVQGFTVAPMISLFAFFRRSGNVIEMHENADEFKA